MFGLSDTARATAKNTRPALKKPLFIPSPQPPNRNFQQLLFQQLVPTECQASCGNVELHCLLGALCRNEREEFCNFDILKWR